MHSGPPQPKGTYALISLGCPKNLVDSERMAGLLGLEGYRMVAEPEGADFVVINTCGFIGNARDESHSVIREMLDLKRRGRPAGSSWPAAWPSAIGTLCWKPIPEIDQLLGVFARDEIARGRGPPRRRTRATAEQSGQAAPAARNLAQSAEQLRAVFHPAPARPLADTHRRESRRDIWRFSKSPKAAIACAVSARSRSLRGPYASKPIEQVVAEAEELVADGTRELILVAQDTSYYGMDLYGRPRLAELLARLDQIDGLAWIRLMYLYPQHIDDELIDAIAGAEADRAVSRLAAAAHQRRHAPPHAPPDQPRRNRAIARPACASESRGLSCGPR